MGGDKDVAGTIELGEEPLSDVRAGVSVATPTREEMLADKAPESILEVTFRELGWRFELRRLRSLRDLDEVSTQARLLREHPGFKLEGGETVHLTPVQAMSIAWVRACLVEPKLSTADVVAISQEHGYVISTLAEFAINHNGADGQAVETAKKG